MVREGGKREESEDREEGRKGGEGVLRMDEIGNRGRAGVNHNMLGM